MASSQEVEYRTLPELLEAGARAFSTGNFPQAAQAFNHIRLNYQEEPEWLQGELPQKLLPIAGFASMKAGFYSDAISALDFYLADYADNQDSEAFARYTLAVSLQRADQSEKAREAFARLRAGAVGTPLHDLATIRQARLSDDEIAIKLLTETVLDPASQRLATRARLELIRIAARKEDLSLASEHLLNSPWNKVAMPELASLSFLAFQVGDSLVDTDPYAALRAYRLVSPTPQLIEEQRRRIAELEQTIALRTPDLRTEHSLWSEFYREVLSTLENQLAALESGPDYSDTLNFRKALCFSNTGRLLEAWILLEHLSLHASDDIKAASHLQWISVARQMRAWNASAQIAMEYIVLYPKRDDVDQALYWIAQSQMDAEDYDLAIETLQALLARSTNGSLQASAHYFTGYCHSLLGDNQAAIDSFQQAIDLQPDKPLAAQASLWIGICHFSEQAYVTAIETFRAVEANDQWIYIHPEAAYRRAAALYAIGEYETALAKIEAWLGNHPGHLREPEALLLQGDLLRDKGRSKAAIASYLKVDHELRELRFFALSNAVELQLEIGQLEAALEGLEQYAAGAIPREVVGSYFSLWSRCLIEAGQANKAKTLIADAIASHGNDPQAQGILQLIELSNDLAATTIEPIVETLYAEGKATLASRYLLGLANAFEAKGEVVEAQIRKLRLATHGDREVLPPECLVAAGFTLQKIGSIDATAYFEQTLLSFPASEYASLARYGLARDAANRQDFETALSHLDLVDTGLVPSKMLARVLIFTAELQRERGLLEASQANYELILAQKGVDSAFKAAALNGLGKICLKNEDPNAAYAYFQRVFTLYRAEHGLVSDAYLGCIQILVEAARYKEANAVCEEFLGETNLSNQPAYALAQNLSQDLQNLIERDALATR